MRTRRRVGRLSAAVVACGLLFTFMVAPVRSQTAEFSNGTASATAQSVKVNPTAAALSLGITFGISLTGYTNEVAKAEARGIDLGIIGTTLASEGCDGGDPSFPAEDQPQPLSFDSRQEGAAAGRTEPEEMGGQTIPLFEKFARATPQPLGEAAATTAPLGQAGAVEIAGARSHTVSRVVDGNTREAVAVTEIGRLDLGGGAVRLGGLRWEAIHRSGAEQSQVGTFTIGSVSIAGSLLPIPTNDPAQVFAAVNQALAPLGIELRPPTTRTVNEAVVVDPLTVAVVPSSTRDRAAGELLGTVQPVRAALVEALLQMDCGNATYITIADIALGSLTGAGSFSLEFGGVSAHTGELQLTSLLGGLGGGFGTIPAIPDVIRPGVPPSVSAIPGTPGLAVSGSEALAPEGSQETAAPVASRSFEGSRGGMLALLAGLVLAMLAGAAEADRRKMRRALQMSTTTEA